MVIGLFVYLLLSCNGLLTGLGLPFLPAPFTPQAMILAQTILAFPLVAGFTATAVAGVDQGMTVVFATHNPFQARRMGQQVALLLDGQLVEVAETERFFENPRNPRTAAFVRGEMIY